jgi:hypothetical protein
MLLAECFYPLVMLFLKVSLSLFFLRITPVQWQRYAIYITLAVSTIANIMFFFLMLFQCGKPGKALGLITKKALGQCIPATAGLVLSYSHGILDTLSDVLFATLPYWLLRHSTMARREKWSAASILVLAAL